MSLKHEPASEPLQVWAENAGEQARTRGKNAVEESMRLKYEPASEPLHIYVKWLFLGMGG